MAIEGSGDQMEKYLLIPLGHFLSAFHKLFIMSALSTAPIFEVTVKRTVWFDYSLLSGGPPSLWTTWLLYGQWRGHGRLVCHATLLSAVDRSP